MFFHCVHFWLKDEISGDDPVHQEFLRQYDSYWTKVLIYDSIVAG